MFVVFRPLYRMSRVFRRKTVKASRIRSRHVRNRPRHLNPALVVQVVDSVPVLVIVHVVGHTSRTPEHGLLGLGLDTLSSTGNTTGPDPGLQERTIVGAAIELNLGVIQKSNLVKVLGEFLL